MVRPERSSKTPSSSGSLPSGATVARTSPPLSRRGLKIRSGLPLATKSRSSPTYSRTRTSYSLPAAMSGNRALTSWLRSTPCGWATMFCSVA